MTLKPVLAVLAVAFATPAFAAVVMHGGAWVSQIAGGEPRRICMTHDSTFDAQTLSKMFAMEGVQCGTPAMGGLGPVTTYQMTCQIGGGKMTIKETITPTGLDAYTTHSTSHYEGGSIKMADTDNIETSHRVGSCLPSDRKSAF
jgi:hypothetical protein